MRQPLNILWIFGLLLVVIPISLADTYKFSIEFNNIADITSARYIGDEKITMKPQYICADYSSSSINNLACYRYLLNEFPRDFEIDYDYNEYLSYVCHKNSAYITNDGWDDEDRYSIVCDYSLSNDFMDISIDSSSLKPQGYFDLNENASLVLNITNKLFGFAQSGIDVDYYVLSGVQRDITPILYNLAIPKGKSALSLTLKTDEISEIKTELTPYITIGNTKFKLNKQVNLKYFVTDALCGTSCYYVYDSEVVILNNTPQEQPYIECNVDSDCELSNEICVYNQCEIPQCDDCNEETEIISTCPTFISELPTYFGKPADCSNGWLYLVIGSFGLLIFILIIKKK